MILTRKSVELLAPAGDWEALEAAVESGADAVYLGGKRFNMRLHRKEANFDDDALRRAVELTRARGVKLYITVNNLLSDAELPELRDYLRFLEEIGPDALIVQDLAALQLARETGFGVPLHASVMMNVHNEHAVRKLQSYGVSRVVLGREMTLRQLALIKERTGVEMEYFVHGDMCVAESGQCYHSGVLYGQSSNRGRCLKPCRWPYQLVDEETRAPLAEDKAGPYKLAIKDMCMYRNLPELIQAGVHSFKIEGRMRPAAFVSRIVRAYREAIDRYIADPMGYETDEAQWRALYESRARDFSTCFALGKPDASAIGFSGEREPRFFSRAAEEPGLSAAFAPNEARGKAPRLAVRAADLASVRAACENGADAVYVGGEAMRPRAPWTLGAIREAVRIAHGCGAQLIAATPRTTMERECGELRQFLAALQETLPPDGVLAGNLGSLTLAAALTDLPVRADFSLNLFNSLSARFLQQNGAAMGTISLEAGREEALALAAESALALELVVHGTVAAMLADHDIPGLSSPRDPLGGCAQRARCALLDEAGALHPIRLDQYGRSHILFAKDLCLFQQLGALTDFASLRIEALEYGPEEVAFLTKTYRVELEAVHRGEAGGAESAARLAETLRRAPRALGEGAFSRALSR